MPNRTIYLPDELDRVSRELELNLSRVTQDAIRVAAAEHHKARCTTHAAEISARAAALDIDWPADVLDADRDQAGER